MKYRIFIAIVIAATFSGCARLTSIHRDTPLEPSGDKLFAIDAKQRIVVTSHRTSYEYDENKKPIKTISNLITCAEPSPDALSVISAAFSSSLDVSGKGALGLNNAINESGSNIGLRTQSIQLLRDGMYRLCEGYMGGAISDVEFQLNQRRYQNIMVGLLAIEQLTGVVRPPQVVLGGNLAVDAGEKLIKAQQLLDDSVAKEKALITAAEEAKSTESTDNKAAVAKEAEAAKAGATQETKDAAAAARKKADQSAVKTKEAKKAAAEATINRESLERMRNSARLADVAATSAFALEQQQVTKADKTKIADKVYKIVELVVQEDYTKDACMSFALDKGRYFNTPGAVAVRKVCEKVFEREALEAERASAKAKRDVQQFNNETILLQRKAAGK